MDKCDDYASGPDPGNCDAMSKKASMPKSMGGFGQPDGRKQEAMQERDSNHPQGSGNHRPGIETA